MKKFTLPFVIALFTTQIEAQNVGIGTSSPEQKLDVIGSIGMRNAAAWDHLYFTHSGNLVSVNAGGADAGMAFNIGTGASGSYGGQTYSEVMRLLPNGNVGIGTASPGATLQVNGSFKLGAANSTTLTSLGQASGTFGGGTIPANSSATFSLNVGLTTNAAIMFNPNIDLPDGIILSYVRGSNTGTIYGKMYNVKSVPVVVPDFTVTVTWIK